LSRIKVHFDGAVCQYTFELPPTDADIGGNHLIGAMLPEALLQIGLLLPAQFEGVFTVTLRFQPAQSFTVYTSVPTPEYVGHSPE
jgi:hypothetical protein